MERILIVEDSHTFSSLLSRRMREAFDCETVLAASYREAAAILERDRDFLVALLDVNLPDAPSGEVVDLAASLGLPSIVFTGELDDALRDVIWSKRIVDYVFKDRIESLDYLVNLISQLRTNEGTRILVVDDSKTSRRLIADLLRIRRYSVMEAADGLEALEMLKSDPGFSLVVSDYNMPRMDGFDLVREIRRIRPREELPVIGVSAEQSSWVSARFIKQGANDYLNKPFSSEEFYCRIAQNLEMLDYIRRIKEFANRDFMTKAYNRKYFFEEGAKLYADRVRRGQPVAVAMMDIDHFKKVNDAYGHDAGDEVIKHLARALESRFTGGDVVARFGGEEFCVLALNIDNSCVTEVFEALREAVARGRVVAAGREIGFTVSVGVCCDPLGSLEEMIKAADEMLYVSKNSGRNRVSVHASCGLGRQA